MAEQGGFFRRIFSFGQKPDAQSEPEVDRRAEEQNLVAAPDIGARKPSSPDNDSHGPAAASTDTDREAGADPSADDQGGIAPLNPSAPPSSSATAEKKTPNS